jgi:hypothetical protein
VSRLAAALAALVLGAAMPAVGAPASDDVPKNLDEIPADRALQTGRYYDTFPEPGKAQSYRIDRTIDKAWVYFGITPLDPDVRLPRRPAASIDTSGGVGCGNSAADYAQPTALNGLTQAGVTRNNDACVFADAFELTVTGPKGVPAGTPFELTIYELPPVAKYPDTTYTWSELEDPLVVAEPTRQVAGGPTRPEASVLSDGQPVHVDLSGGQAAWFALTDVQIDRFVTAYAEVTDPSRSFQGRNVEIRLVSPVGGIGSIRDDEDQEDPSGPIGTVGTRPVRVENHSYWLASATLYEPGNGEELASKRLSALEGTWYVVLYLSGPTDQTASVTLTAKTSRSNFGGLLPDPTRLLSEPPTLAGPIGAEPEPWEPPAETPTPASPASSPSAQTGDTPDVRNSGEAPWQLILAFLAGAAVSAGVGGYFWRRRAR